LSDHLLFQQSNAVDLITFEFKSSNKLYKRNISLKQNTQTNKNF